MEELASPLSLAQRLTALKTVAPLLVNMFRLLVAWDLASAPLLGRLPQRRRRPAQLPPRLDAKESPNAEPPLQLRTFGPALRRPWLLLILAASSAHADFLGAGFGPSSRVRGWGGVKRTLRDLAGPWGAAKCESVATFVGS